MKIKNTLETRESWISKPVIIHTVELASSFILILMMEKIRAYSKCYVLYMYPCNIYIYIQSEKKFNPYMSDSFFVGTLIYRITLNLY